VAFSVEQDSFLSKEKSQQVANGKMLTFLECNYEIVYAEGGMYGAAPSLFPPPKRQEARYMHQYTPFARACESWSPDTQMIRQKS